MELKDVLNGVIGMALNMPEAEVSSLYDEEGNLKEGSFDALKARHAERVKQEREKATADRSEQYKRGLKEKGAEWEKFLKDAGVDIGDAIGADAVQKLKDHIEAAAKPSDLEDDKVKAHKLYREMERKAQADLAAKEAEFKQAWADRDAKEQRERILARVKEQAKTVLDELKPNLPEDPKKAAKQIGFLMAELDGLSYEMDGDELLIKDKDGKRLENSHGHPIKLEELVKEKSSEYFDFQVSDKKGSAGDITKGTKGAIKLEKPTTRQAYADQLHKISTDPSLTAEERVTKAAELKELAKDIAA